VRDSQRRFEIVTDVLCRACARNGIHYIDISGLLLVWYSDVCSPASFNARGDTLDKRYNPRVNLIRVVPCYLLITFLFRFDYLASKNHSIIVPSCGFDSIPSDFSAYLSVRALKQRLGPDVETARSVTAHKFQGGISGGTLRTLYTHYEMIPQQKIIASLQDHVLSPAPGAASPPIKILYSMPYVTPRIFGAFLLMSPMNRSTVLRTRGLLEVNPSMRSLKYGPEFNYEEFLVTPNRLAGAIISLTVLALGFCLSASSTVSHFMTSLELS
jgi:hypothetical protein